MMNKIGIMMAEVISTPKAARLLDSLIQQYKLQVTTRRSNLRIYCSRLKSKLINNLTLPYPERTQFILSRDKRILKMVLSSQLRILISPYKFQQVTQRGDTSLSQIV